MSKIVNAIEASQLRSDLPDFKVGDTIRVHAKIIEGDKERIQVFEGAVISRANGVNRATLRYAKFPMASAWNEFSRCIPRGLIRSRSSHAVGCVAPSCIISVNCPEKLRVLKANACRLFPLRRLQRSLLRQFLLQKWRPLRKLLLSRKNRPCSSIPALRFRRERSVLSTNVHLPQLCFVLFPTRPDR